MSWVFLTETHAWKLKKPVRYEHLDFSTPEARRYNCEQELLLNRRLAANVYVGVVPLTVDAGGLRIGGSGPPVDWLVQMRRLPDERMLNRAIVDHTCAGEELRKVGTLLAGFYNRSSPVENSGTQYRQRVSDEFHASCLEVRRPEYNLQPELVDDALRKGAQFIELRRSIFDEWVDAGIVIDGHGELRPEHI